MTAYLNEFRVEALHNRRSEHSGYLFGL